jgi:hypothetical protein
MEHNILHSIAKAVFDAMEVSSWKDKSLDEIELHTQKLISQVANTLLQDFVLPTRVNDIERSIDNGQTRCRDCNSLLKVHKADQAIHPKTIFGDQISLCRSQYYCSGCDNYQVVADQVLDMTSHRMTPRLALVVALCAASWPYAIASAFICFLFGVNVSAKTCENVIKDKQLSSAPLGTDPLDNPPGVVTMDGILVRSRKQDQWLEMKVASFFSNVAEISKNRREVLDASFVAGAMKEWKDFVPAVTEEAERRGLNFTEAIEFVADGAEGIWSLQQMVFPYAKPRLDLYHSKCKVGQRINQAYKRNPKRDQHEEKLQGCLDKGMVDEAIIYINKHLPKYECKREAAVKLIGYLQRHKDRIPNYERVKAEGGTVSSGLTEKANDLIVARRMKHGQMHWTREGAEPVLKHRTVFINKHARARTGPYEVAFCRNFFQ